MRANFDHNVRPDSQRLADLKSKAAELERELSAARVSLELELTRFTHGVDAAAGDSAETRGLAPGDAGPGHDTANSGGEPRWSQERTEVLVNHGRPSAYYPGLSGRWKVVIATALAVALAAVLALTLSRAGASWPPSVATVQGEAARACLNPDVKSEPGQVNFACAKTTRQILWVFALLTSADNPDFADTKTGRLGLEPITPTQGGEVAWSLNLHHPYDPSNPTDSLQVAARAINNIIGGATVTGADGNVVVQSGLESDSANCVRYTGSAALFSRKGFPSLCARPVTGPAGQAALVADVYKKWIVGATAQAAQDAAVLFENATNPGAPRVQGILKHLPSSKPSA
jgi:hypothetical protein